MPLFEPFEMLKKPSPNSLLSRLTQNTWLLSSLPLIIEKLEEEGLLNILFQSLDVVITNEVTSTANQISQLRREELEIDPEILLAKNLMIFKENLKVITGYMSNVKSRATLQTSY